MTNVLQARNLKVGYGPTPVLHGIDLHVAPGEVVALMGANGAGKTTTLLTLAGELRPMHGTVESEGEELRGSLYQRARRGLALVTEERSVFMGLTVLENLRVGGVAPDAAMDLFPELRPRARTRAGLLSGGEQQMLTVARAMQRKPKILLADELSLGLAPLVVDRLLQAVRDYAKAQNSGVLLVEQHVRKVLAHADRGYVLQGGRMSLSGTARELRSSLATIESSYLAAASAT